MRSGYALKRLDASEGTKRWVLRDLDSGKFLRLTRARRGAVRAARRRHSLVELIVHAEQRFGAGGSARVARLLADLGERGFLAGVAGRATRRKATRRRAASAAGSART